MSNNKKNSKNVPPNKPKERKSILRAPSQAESSGRRASDSSTRESKKRIKWDEMNVIATLHPVGKDYGHQKIDEAPTPFERHEQPVDAKELAKRLEEINRRERKFRSSTSSNAEDGSVSGEQSRRESFAKKRKEHYQEFTIAKRYSQQRHQDDEDED